MVAQPLSARLGQQVIIENRPGAGTSIGVKAAAASPPDGYTLLMYGQNITYLQMLYPDLGFDPVKAFVPIAPIADYFHVVVISPALPAKTLKEFVAYAKANPGKLNFGIGLGTMPQIIGEYFNLVAGLDIVTIPYARRRAGARRYPRRAHPDECRPAHQPHGPDQGRQAAPARGHQQASA